MTSDAIAYELYAKRPERIEKPAEMCYLLYFFLRKKRDILIDMVKKGIAKKGKGEREKGIAFLYPFYNTQYTKLCLEVGSCHKKKHIG